MTNDRYACGGVVILSYLMLYVFEIFHDNFFKISGKKKVQYIRQEQEGGIPTNASVRA